MEYFLGMVLQNHIKRPVEFIYIDGNVMYSIFMPAYG